MRTPNSGIPSLPGPGLIAAVGPCRGALIGLALFSAVINVLYLTGSFYMLQVYDRVIPSRSVPTLVALSILAAALYAGQAALDFCRSAFSRAWRDPSTSA